MDAKCRWCHSCAKETMETLVPQHLQHLLPEHHSHHICSFVPLDHGFTALVKVKMSTREEANTWLEDFQRSSKVTLRVSKTYPAEGRLRHNSYRVDLRCQHNTRQTEHTKKNTRCPAVLYLVLKKQSFSQNRKSRSTDAHIKEGLLLHLTLKHHHNHVLDAAEVLGQRDVSPQTVEKLEKLFQSGYTPSLALRTLKHHLQEQHRDQYHSVSADRSICPHIHFCYRLYHSLLKRDYGATSGDVMTADLQEHLDQAETCQQMFGGESCDPVGESCDPVGESCDPVGESCDPVGESCEQVGESCDPVGESCDPVGESCDPVGESCEQVGESCDPVGESCDPVGESCEQVGESCDPVGESCDPVGESCDPVGESCDPVGESCDPVGESCDPVGESCDPVGESCDPVGESCEQVGESCEQVGESCDPVGESCDPVGESCDPVGESCDPVGESCDPVGESCDPVGESCDPVGESCDPVGESCEQVGESCDPVGESCDPVGESCDPVGESCDPVGESCDPVGESCDPVGESCDPVEAAASSERVEGSSLEAPDRPHVCEDERGLCYPHLLSYPVCV